MSFADKYSNIFLAGLDRAGAMEFELAKIKAQNEARAQQLASEVLMKKYEQDRKLMSEAIGPLPPTAQYELYPKAAISPEEFWSAYGNKSIAEQVTGKSALKDIVEATPAAEKFGTGVLSLSPSLGKNAVNVLPQTTGSEVRSEHELKHRMSMDASRAVQSLSESVAKAPTTSAKQAVLETGISTLSKYIPPRNMYMLATADFYNKDIEPETRVKLALDMLNTMTNVGSGEMERLRTYTGLLPTQTAVTGTSSGGVSGVAGGGGIGAGLTSASGANIIIDNTMVTMPRSGVSTTLKQAVKYLDTLNKIISNSVDLLSDPQQADRIEEAKKERNELLAVIGRGAQEGLRNYYQLAMSGGDGAAVGPGHEQKVQIVSLLGANELVKELSKNPTSAGKAMSELLPSIVERILGKPPEPKVDDIVLAGFDAIDAMFEKGIPEPDDIDKYIDGLKSKTDLSPNQELWLRRQFNWNMGQLLGGSRWR